MLLQYGRDYRIRVLPDGFKQLVPVPESAERWELIYYPKLEELLAAWDASSEARKEAMQQLIRHWGHRATVVALAPEARASFSAKVMRWLEIYRREFPNSNYLSPLYHSVAVMLLSSDPRQALAFVRETSARHASGSLLDVLRRKRFAGLERLFEGHLQPVELFWTELQEIAPELGDRSRYRGKVVLISMTPVTWATHIPTLEKLYAEHSAAGLEIIQIAQYNTNSAAPPEQRDRAAMERFIAAKGWRWKVIWDPNGQDGIREKWGMNSYPAHFVIGRDGRIFNYRGGALDYIDDIPRALAQPTQ